MSIEEPEAIARRFVETWNAKDTQGLETLFHPDFTWHIAVTPPDVSEMRPMHSKLLKGMNLPWEKAIYDKAETIRIFSNIFANTPSFGIELVSITAQENRVALEVTGKQGNENPANGRQYSNIYCYMFTVKDGLVILFREYQDTLLLFDVWVAD